jgi:four helix bundle protein
MKEANPILEMSYSFALDVTAAAKAMRERKEYDLASQFWRAGTSIGANVEEAQAAQSRADFKSKMGIAAKEARETIYWIRLARDSGILDAESAESLLKQASSIQKILTSIVKTTSENP